MDAPQVLERTRQQLIKKLPERKKEIEHQLNDLGYKEKAKRPLTRRRPSEAVAPAAVLYQVPNAGTNAPFFRISAIGADSLSASP